MLLFMYSQTAIQANCYIWATGQGGNAVVIDPGAGSAPWVSDMLSKHELELGAVLLTHGHPDHVWDAAAVAGDKPVYIASPDAYRLEDPMSSTFPGQEGLFIGTAGHNWERPANVVELPGEFLAGQGSDIVPGIFIRAIPTPGHTEGSTSFLASGTLDEVDGALTVSRGCGGNCGCGSGGCGSEPDGGEPPALTVGLLFCGDVIIGSSVGRTDLPGGDQNVLTWTLRTLAQSVDPDTIVLSGHGAASTMGGQLMSNDMLRAAVTA